MKKSVGCLDFALWTSEVSLGPKSPQVLFLLFAALDRIFFAVPYPRITAVNLNPAKGNKVLWAVSLS